MFVPLIESGRAALRLRPLPVVLLAAFGNMTSILGTVAVATLTAGMLVWFILAELIGQQMDRQQAKTDSQENAKMSAQLTVELLNDVMRSQKPKDERNGLIADIMRLGNTVSLIINDMGHEARRNMEAQPKANDSEKAKIIALAGANAVNRFNDGPLDALRDIVARAKKFNPHIDSAFERVVENGASTMDDVNIAYADLDNLMGQLLYEIYEHFV